MKPEGSLPHSQVPASCPYPEPARSSPYLHTLLRCATIRFSKWILLQQVRACACVHSAADL